MKLKVRIPDSKCIRFYNSSSMWTSFFGVVTEILEISTDEVQINTNKTYKFSGNVSFKPEPRINYIITTEYVKDEKWGWQMEIVTGYEDVSLETDEEKKSFLNAILTPLQVKNLYKKYDNPFIYIQNGDIEALSKVDGIGNIVAERIINKFRSSEDLAPAFAFFSPIGVSPNMIKKLCDTYTGAQAAIQEFKTNPYILADDVEYVGFIKADEIALNYGIEVTSSFRIKAGITYFLKKYANDEGSTWIDGNTFKSETVKLLGIEFKYIMNVVKFMIQDNLLYVDKEKNRLALRYYYNLEGKIRNKLQLLKDYETPTIDKEYVAKIISNTQCEQGFDFTEEQIDGIYEVMKNNVCVVIGGAGVGKSTVIKGVYNALKDGTEIYQCAFSGQASKRINEATGYPSSTIHRLLGYNGHSFEKNSENPLNKGIIILDEASMVNLELFWHLIDAIPLGSKLILLGDTGQLPPIGAGNLLMDIIKSNIIKVVELTKIHRQAAKSAIITTSYQVRSKKPIVEPEYEGDEILGELKDLILEIRQEKDDLSNMLIRTFMEEFDKLCDISKIQIILAQNKKVALSRQLINEEIQRLVNPAKAKEKSIKLGDKSVARVGDKVINRKNCYRVFTNTLDETNIYNGSMGIIEKIVAIDDIENMLNEEYIIVDFFGEGKVILKQENYFNLELAYAITCHSSQGSQFDITIVAFDNSSYVMLSNEWLYTAITRAKKKCYIIAENKALNIACTSNKIKHRKTFLKEFLSNGIEVEILNPITFKDKQKEKKDEG